MWTVAKGSAVRVPFFVGALNTAGVNSPPYDTMKGFTGQAAVTGLKISKNGGAFATPHAGGVIHEIGQGWYYYDLDATDTNTDGPLIFSIPLDSQGYSDVGLVFLVVG